MRSFKILLWMAFVLLQYQLWFGKHGVQQLVSTKTEIGIQQIKSREKKAENDRIARNIVSLQYNVSNEIEAHAREDLGMIKQGETFYFVPEK